MLYDIEAPWITETEKNGIEADEFKEVTCECGCNYDFDILDDYSKREAQAIEEYGVCRKCIAFDKGYSDVKRMKKYMADHELTRDFLEWLTPANSSLMQSLEDIAGMTKERYDENIKQFCEEDNEYADELFEELM